MCFFFSLVGDAANSHQVLQRLDLPGHQYGMGLFHWTLLVVLETEVVQDYAKIGYTINDSI